MRTFKVDIEKYSPEHKNAWDNFVDKAKNGNFIFKRNYMEYHSDRFKDNSLLFTSNGKVVAILPGSIKDNTLNSHNGLTFGGIISDKKMKTYKMLTIFDALKDYLRQENITTLNYKTIPHVYHTIPAQEDIYCLHINNAKLTGRDFTSSFKLDQNLFEKRGNANNAAKNNLQIKENCNIEEYWKLLADRLMDKYGALPVHTVEEIKHLQNAFPQHINLLTAHKNNELLAGVVMYKGNSKTSRLQYQAISENGKNHYALDFIYSELFNRLKDKNKYIDFGTSIVKESGMQNMDLLNFKETLGARILTQDTYTLAL